MKNAALIVVLAGFCLGGFANTQAPPWMWVKSAAGTGEDVSYGISATVNGYVYVTGRFTSPTLTFGSTELINAYSGTSDIYVVKYDTAGNVIWAKSAGGVNDDEAYAISADARGNVYVIGTFTDSLLALGNDTLRRTGNQDVFVVKYGPAGNIVWARGATENASDLGQSVTTDAAGNVYIIGEFNSTAITFGDSTLTGDNGNDIFIVKYDSSGNVLWAKTGGGAVLGVCAMASGGVYVTGYFNSPSITFGAFTLTNASESGTNDIFIVKYDAAGNVLWAKSAGGSGDDAAGQVSVNARGDVYVAGEFSSPEITFDTTTLVNAGIGYNDIFLTRYDSLGNIIWAKRLGGVNEDVTWGISATESGNVFLIGNFFSPSIAIGDTTLTNMGGNDFFVTKFDESGNVVWVKSAGGIDNDYINSISADAGENVYVTGYFISPTIAFGRDTMFNNNYDAIFVSKIGINSVSGIDVDAVGFDGITVYPNPSTGAIYFKGIESGTRVEVYDLLGQVVHSSLATDDNYSVNLFGNARGVYFYRVINNGMSVQAGKIVVE